MIFDPRPPLYRPPVLSDTFPLRNGALARQGRPALLRGRGSRHVRARRPPAAPALAQDLVPRPLRPPQGDRVRDVVPAPQEGPRADGAPRPCERDRARAPQSAVPDRDGRLSPYPRRVVAAEPGRPRPGDDRPSERRSRSDEGSPLQALRGDERLVRGDVREGVRGVPP